MDLHDLDSRALEGMRKLVAQVRADQLRLPTPCADWTLHGLLRHLVSQNLGFAAAARGDEPDLAVWDSGSLGEDPLSAFDQSARQVTDAFTGEDLLQRAMHLPELNVSLPGQAAVSFHFLDYLVHGWDVARTIGVPAEMDADLVAAAVKIFSGPRPELRPVREPFAQIIPLPDNASVGDQLLGRLGRDPNWSAA